MVDTSCADTSGEQAANSVDGRHSINVVAIVVTASRSSLSTHRAKTDAVVRRLLKSKPAGRV
jgi:hypothetical protein